jgi:hypothetical protein
MAFWGPLNVIANLDNNKVWTAIFFRQASTMKASSLQTFSSTLRDNNQKIWIPFLTRLEQYKRLALYDVSKEASGVSTVAEHSQHLHKVKGLSSAAAAAAGADADAADADAADAAAAAGS